MIHIPIAIFIQLVVGFLAKDWWLGAAAGSAFFVAREITQAEYRWIDKYGSGKRANMPQWGAFDTRVWNVKSVVDFIAPTVAVVIVAWVL